jgi:Asp-tRNA(Asn)/Glu-tRNA(Gln) amidotransferase A subunit family amidase
MKALAPGPPATPVALEDLQVAVAWLDDADPGVRARVAAAAGHFPRCTEIGFPRMPANIDAAFQREVADVHRELFGEHAGLYGRNVRRKVERALEVTDEDHAASVAARERYREEATAALAGFDLLVVPTIGTVAPPRRVKERDLRPTVLRFTEPFNVLGWPALALPCGEAEDGLPASVTLAARSNEDDCVLEAGVALEDYAGPAERARTASS